MSLQDMHPFWMVLVSIGFAALPIVIGLLTSFLKISIVLQFFRAGLGAQQVPSGLVIMLLSGALTLTVMAPVLEESFAAIQKLEQEDFSKPMDKEAIRKSSIVVMPWIQFLERHTAEREKRIFEELLVSARQQAQKKKEAAAPSPDREVLTNLGEGSVLSLLPAFVISELRRAFSIGFIVLLPMLVIDLIVANLLVGMGMFMVSPVMISLPIKLLIFIAADGWNLLAVNLVQSYWGAGGV